MHQQSSRSSEEVKRRHNAQRNKTPLQPEHRARSNATKMTITHNPHKSTTAHARKFDVIHPGTRKDLSECPSPFTHDLSERNFGEEAPRKEWNAIKLRLRGAA